MERVWYSRGMFVLFIFLLAPLAHAAAYSVDVIPKDNNIGPDEIATYDIEINNFQGRDARFQVYTVDPSWIIKTEPIAPLVPANDITRFSMTLRPGIEPKFGAQAVSVTFKDLTTGSIIRKDIVISVQSDNLPFGEYQPAVALEDVELDYLLDPREPVDLRLEMKNSNRLDMENLTITVSSPHFYSEFDMSLAPLSQRTKDVPGLSIDPLASPGDAVVSIIIMYEGKIITQFEQNYKIAEYTEIRKDIKESSFLFKTEKEILVTNDGNVENTALVKIPTSLIKSMFVSSSLNNERLSENGQQYLVWTIPLDPNDSETFTYVENYRILVLLLLIAAIAGLVYLLLRSPVVVVKEAVGVMKTEGVSMIKVRIFVKNRSAKMIRSLQITDRVPSLADVVKAEAPGSISPSKIAVSEKKGTLLRWQLEVLEPYEERVLTYQAKSKLKIIGKMSLPNTKTRFTVKGKERVVFSNNIELVERFKDK